MGKSELNMHKDDKILLASIHDRMQRCSRNYMITWSNFLDLRQRSMLSDAISHKSIGKDFHIDSDPEVKFSFYGAYPEAERSVVIFLPSYIQSNAYDYFISEPDENPLTLLRASLPKGAPHLTHRDYLGALTGTGIKREIIGDIIVYENGADIIVLREMANYIKMNMTNAGRAVISWEELPVSELRLSESNRSSQRVSVSSLRLDNIVAAAFKLSRVKSSEAIGAGIVYVDDMRTEKPEKLLNPGCKLVLRGRGKAVFKSIEGNSSKGRIIIVIENFL